MPKNDESVPGDPSVPAIYSAATDELARVFHRELFHAGVGIEEWEALAPFERDAYRGAIAGLLLSWPLLCEARAAITSQP